ncbi:SirB2 family protein [Zoogloeaceae bacterium G21618-S1]|nr:SirB2 family protein [Zoogloeaceae bacterium G21618-S1]
MYLTIKHIHITCVTLSGLGFLVRAWWMLTDSPRLQHRLTRILPHVIDTLLLSTAIALSVMMAQYPFVHGWVSAKVFGLLAYIGFGTVALKRGRTAGVRRVALAAAVLTFGWIVSVALTKSPAGIFGVI